MRIAAVVADDADSVNADIDDDDFVVAVVTLLLCKEFQYFKVMFAYL